MRLMRVSPGGMRRSNNMITTRPALCGGRGLQKRWVGRV